MKINAQERAVGFLGYTAQRTEQSRDVQVKNSSRDAETDRSTRNVTRESGLATTQTVVAKNRAKNVQNTRDTQEKQKANVREERKVEQREDRDEKQVQREQDNRRYDEQVKGRKIDVLA